MVARVLVVDDEQAIREMVGFALEHDGLSWYGAENVRAARAALTDGNPDLILLDWMLPGQSGIEYARELKRDAATREIPLIMLTARGTESDVVTGLDTGADDYIPKPFSPRELIARVRAVLRRAAPHVSEAELGVGELRLDPAAHRVTAGGQPLRMGPTEYRLLKFLLSHPERVYSRGQLLDQVWGRAVYIEERTVDVHIRRLREALAPGGCENYIQTVRGAGYRFSAQA